MFHDWLGYGGNDMMNMQFENQLSSRVVISLISMKAYVDFRRRGFDIKGIRYDDLVARPFEICQRLLEACGLDVSLAEKAITCIKNDSQRNTKISQTNLKKLRIQDLEITPQIAESLNSLAAKYDMPPINEECILEGTMY